MSPEDEYVRRNPWRCHRHPYMRDGFELMDTTGLGFYDDTSSLPPEKRVFLSFEQAVAVALAVKREDTLEQLVSSSFDREIIRRQFGLIEKAIDGLNSGVGKAP